MTLIHLVSEQTMQNILPAMALKPQRVIFIASQVSSSRINNEKNALKLAGTVTEFIEEILLSEFPSWQETRDAVVKNIPADSACVINLTGGTKLMCIGAWTAAQEHHVPSFYCHTLTKSWLTADTGPMPDMPGMASLNSRLTVKILMAAHGKDESEWKSDTVTNELLDFARSSWDLHKNYHEQLSAWLAKLRAHVRRGHNGRIPDKAELKNTLAEPLPRAETEAVVQLLDAACVAGLVLADLAGSFYLNATSRSDVEVITNLLEGTWLELALFHHLSNNPKYADIHWSVEPATRQNEEYGETDIVAVDTEKLSLAIFSCKSSLEHVKMLEHLAALRDRADRLGGKFASACLFLFETKSADQESSLRQYGKQLQVHILLASEITLDN
jgi:hypothetical protein